MSDKADIRIHFGSGRSVDTTLELDEGDDGVIEEAIEEAILGSGEEKARAKPNWTWVGDVFLYTQTIEGVEIL